MSQEKAKALIGIIDNIPPLPEVSSEIMVELNNEDVSMADVGKLIEKDIALAAQILKVANSPAYGTTKTISTIQHAIVVVGLEEVRSLLLGFAVQKFFNINAANTELRQRFWLHSRVCGYTAHALAKHFKRDDSSAFFLAGLIHDIGKLILDQFLHEEFQQVISYIKKYNCSFSVAEQQILGITHCQVAANLLQHWSFPEQVTTQVLRHHGSREEGDFVSGANIVWLANILSKMAGYAYLTEEPALTIEKFSKSQVLQGKFKNTFGIDFNFLQKILAQINDFAAESSTGRVDGR